MSSAVYIKFGDSIHRNEWINFCERNKIEYNPSTVGKNVFYFGGLGIEITFGKSGNEIPKEANTINVSSFLGKNLKDIVMIAKTIMDSFPVEGPRYKCDPELKNLMNDTYNKDIEKIIRKKKKTKYQMINE